MRVSQERWTYVITPAIGGGERTVTNFPKGVVDPTTPWGSDLSSAWMPDGRFIVLSGLRRLSLDTGELRDLTTETGARVSGWYPAVAPNGRTMAFARPSGLAAFGLYVLALSADRTFRGVPRLLSLVDGDSVGPGVDRGQPSHRVRQRPTHRDVRHGQDALAHPCHGRRQTQAGSRG